MSAPLDLDQFEGFTPGPDYTGNGRLFRHANEVLAECKRLRASEASQREEIARLRAALTLCAKSLDCMISARGEVCDGGDLRALFPVGDESPTAALEAAERALAGSHGPSANVTQSLRSALSDLFYAVEGKAIFTDSTSEAMGFDNAREAARAALAESGEGE